ncbi:MAG: hypothetical protein R3B99_24355 [Polyangiales bacterium]
MSQRAMQKGFAVAFDADRQRLDAAQDHERVEGRRIAPVAFPAKRSCVVSSSSLKCDDAADHVAVGRSGTLRHRMQHEVGPELERTLKDRVAKALSTPTFTPRLAIADTAGMSMILSIGWWRLDPRELRVLRECRLTAARSVMSTQVVSMPSGRMTFVEDAEGAPP